MKLREIKPSIPLKGERFQAFQVVLMIYVFVVLIVLPFRISIKPWMTILLFGLFYLISYLLIRWNRNRITVGEIELSQDQILIPRQHKVIAVDNIRKITFHFNYLEKRHANNRQYLSGFAELQITTLDNQHTCKLVIENDRQFNDLKAIFRSWYRKKIEIIEYATNNRLRTLGLELLSGMSYKEVQQLKKELDIQ